MTIILWIYVVSGIIALAMSVIMFIAIVRIWQILSEIIASGAIPSVLNERAKRDARYILKVGYVEDRKKLEKTRQALTKLSDNQEATQLLHQLNELEIRK